MIHCKKSFIKRISVFLCFALLFSSFVIVGTAAAESVRAGGKVSGYIVPELASTNAAIKSGFKVEAAGTSFSAVTDNNGYFQITEVPYGQYTFKISKVNYLTRQITGVNLNGDAQIGTQVSPVAIWAGDIAQGGSGDNAINMSDVVALIEYFNTAAGDGKYVADYDLDKDNAINMTDILIVIQRFNKSQADYPAVNVVITTPNPTTPPPTTPPPTTPPSTTGDLKLSFTKTNETATTYTGTITVQNPNSSYTWNGAFFDIWDVSFETTSNITSVAYAGGGTPIKTVSGNVVKLDLGWMSIIGVGTKVDIVIQATKTGNIVFPQNLKVSYVRAEDITYPEYSGLPASWTKNKADLKASDLIANASEYYNTAAVPHAEKMIIYKPYHPTQIWIGQPQRLSHILNAESNARIQIPNNYVAMGMAFDYEWFKFNPNFMAALGSKENWSCARTQDGSWPIVLGHPDGPFQQEVGNFSDMIKYMVDYFPDNASHDDYTKLSSENDPKWAAAAISSGLSLVVTRETLYGVRGVNFTDFINQAKDPWAEYALVDYAYNRGTASFFGLGVFGSKRQEALNATDITSVFGTGFGDHVPQIKHAMIDMNGDTSNIYDGKVTWTEMENFFTELRKFYARGVPSDAEWTAMKNDVHKAFNVLAQHWGGSTISYRYDFLTLLRVAKQYLPQPCNPRPTGADWYYMIKNKVLN
ncbi:MAG: carboxypeptidase regulatory-like domain-containing protein [Clostridia bacterium]|nr:carboxypeptidase regulatory-like domain-containing protein [Clostridia bacterium]